MLGWEIHVGSGKFVLEVKNYIQYDVDNERSTVSGNGKNETN